MSSNPQYVLAGTTPNFRPNLAAALVRAGFDVSVLAMKGNPVSKISGLKRFVEIPGYSEEDFVAHLERNQILLDELQGTFLWTTDSIMRLIVHSNLTHEVKSRILPTSQSKYWKILGSKSGQIEVFREHKILHPNTYIVPPGGLLPDVRSWKGVMVKGGSFGGGFYIREFQKFGESELAKIPRNWYPILVQEKIDGRRIAIEAFYERGELLCFLHSETFVGNNQFAPSISRAYSRLKDEKVESNLLKLGKSLNLSGMVNVSFILEPITGRYFLFEFDPRPTAWHHLFEYFAVPLRAAAKFEIDIPLSINFDENYHVYEPSRLLSDSLECRKLIRALSVLRGREISGHGIPMVSSFYSTQTLRKNWLKLLLFPLIPARKRIRDLFLNIRQYSPSWLITSILGKQLSRSLSKVLSR